MSEREKEGEKESSCVRERGSVCVCVSERVSVSVIVREKDNYLSYLYEA